MLRLSRSRLRWLVLVTGVLLLTGLRLAPALPLPLVTPVSLIWLLLAGFLLYAGYTVLGAWIGFRAAAVVVVVAVLLPVVGTLVPAPVRLGVRLPCPRNWKSPATWMLRSSPMGSTLIEVEGASLRICYGRPAARGRTMLGGSRVPYGQLWRTGANEPTTLITPTGAVIAGVEVPPGRTALYTVPGPETWEIILNASTSQWGIESEYTEKIRAQELGRAIVPSERSDRFVERLTFSPDSGGVVLEWEWTRVRIPVVRARAGGLRGR
ncbi:MAG TPA: DUF2911 domain-containing protein [Gemmatimonadales bacterium]|nr:DUF2911 domain-containing protein [Gemmatimonadales bacterium]